MKNIVLIGIMGCGKTTVAEILSRELGMPLLEMDSMIEQKYGPIPKLFEQGEDYFRYVESRVAEEISRLSGHVVSTGGGVVLRKSNITELKKNGLVFFIDRPVERIIESVDCSTRPLLKNGPEALLEIFNKRYPLYLSYCDYRIESANDVAGTVESIKEILKNLGLLNP